MQTNNNNPAATIQLTHSGWKTHLQGAFRGAAFKGMTLLDPEAAINEATTALKEGKFGECIRQWNGLFSVVVRNECNVALAVDCTRSMPLFYAKSSRGIMISDSANWLREKLGNPPLDPVRKAEFLMSGLVLNNATLCRNIYQVQSGEAFVAAVAADSANEIVQAKRYRMFRPNGSSPKSYEDLLREYDQVLTRCFERALKVVRGRPILVPLSGGYDSRLMLLMLKRLGVKQVSTYTYGLCEEETSRSQEVARALGVPWRLCDYSPSAWQRAVETEGLREYMRQASNLSSVACLQEWLGIREHIKAGLADNNTVVMPGYAADLPAGSFLSWSCAQKITTRKMFEKSLWRNRLSDWNRSAFPEAVLGAVASEVRKTIDCFSDTVQDWRVAHDTWMFTEKVPKFTVNAIRAADWNGCDWWLPFFDEEFLVFWEGVPVQFRLGERLHCDYTDRLYMSLTNSAPPARRKTDKYGETKPESSWTGVMKKTTKMLREVFNSPVARPFRERRRRKLVLSSYRNDPLGANSIFSESEYFEIAMRGASGNGWFSAKCLDLLE